jgi:uncharacterized SAM-binding protein YcdF (DUF218 family)
MVEIIIILGNRQPEIMRKRVDRALEYFNSSPAEVQSDFSPEPQIVKYLLFSGGASDGKSKPEGAIMMEEYCKGKVDHKFCLLETQSRTTVENLLYSKQLLEKMFSRLSQPKITICTSTFHIKRSLILTKLFFPNYTTKFIHTDETVPQHTYEHEARLLNWFVDEYVKKNLD